MNGQTINSILKITESYQLPEKLLSVLLDDPSKMFEKFLSLGESLEHDWFTEYFEEEHANKLKMAQDFTPQEVCDLLAHVIGRAESIADVCAGTGGLTIGMWRKNPDAKFVCYEYSSRAIPLLLFNLAIRNIEAWVCRCDLLTGEEFEYFKVTKGNQFATVCRCSEMGEIEVSAVVSNPPYSMKYNPKIDNRFPEYDGKLPTSFADYVFVLFALSILKHDGRAGFILPHGVLFRGNKEGVIRKHLLENGTIRSIIGLPDKLFVATDIPTCILDLRKNRENRDVLFIDAKEEFEKAGKKNRLKESHIAKICNAFDDRMEQERFAHLADSSEIAKHEFNLNIPRYVDTFVPEVLPDLVDVLAELGRLEVEANKTKIELLQMSSQLCGTTQQADSEYKKALKTYERTVADTKEIYKQEVMKYVT